MQTWQSPTPGAIILLKEGFESSSSQHYGLVLACFKQSLKGPRFVISAPGTSIKENSPGNYKDKDGIRLVINNSKKETFFYLSEDLYCFDEYPSDAILNPREKSSKKEPIFPEVYKPDSEGLNKKLLRWEYCSGLKLEEMINTILLKEDIEILNQIHNTALKVLLKKA